MRHIHTHARALLCIVVFGFFTIAAMAGDAEPPLPDLQDGGQTAVESAAPAEKPAESQPGDQASVESAAQENDQAAVAPTPPPPQPIVTPVEEEGAMEDFKRGAVKTGQAIKAGSVKAAEAVKSGAIKTGEAAKKGYDKVVEFFSEE